MVKLQQMVGRAKQSRHFVAIVLFVLGTTASILGQLTFPQAASAVATSPENKPVVEKICGSESTPNSDEEIALWNSCAQKVISQYTTCNTGGADSTKIAQCLKTGLGDTAKNVSAQDLKTAVDAGKAAATAEPKTEEECKAKGSTWEWNAETKKCSEKGAEAGKAECAVPGGIGWAICPIMTIVAAMNDTLYTTIAKFMIVDPKLIDTSAESPYPAWQQFQTIANVVFIIGFVVVVYSQITGAGLSNYGVKKMLPKLIVIAVLVNISYFVCQLAVDISNLLGISLRSVFDSIANSNTIGASAVPDGWTKTVAVILAGAGAGLAMLAISTPVLLAAFLALAMIALILILRQALIVLLIVISPVAFALYLLPNTEQWTKKWAKLFFSLLMLFPVIGAVFGASALASRVLVNLDSEMGGVIALGASALPLFVIPGLLKGALAATGKLGAKMQGWGDKATGAASGGMRKKAGERYARSSYAQGKALRKAGEEKYRRSKFAERVQGGGLRARMARGVAVTGAGRSGQGYLESAAAAQVDKDFEENVGAAESQQKLQSWQNRMDIATGKVASSEAERVAAVRHVMKHGNGDDRQAMLRSQGNLAGAGNERARQALSQGYLESGMAGVYGASTADKILNGMSDSSDPNVGTVEDQLNDAALKNIQAGKLKAETVASDAGIAEYIADVAEAGKQSGQLNAGHLTAVRDAANAVDSTPQLAQRVTGQMRPHVDRLKNI